ncbi:MAG TPA: hypothetical protein QGF35_06030 [Dehalococcoidia bacterium]|nr:hypothetical protein [Dehalococcoidia bacterium]
MGNVFSGTAQTFELLLAWRFVAGIGSAVYMTAATIYITDIACDACTRHPSGRPEQEATATVEAVASCSGFLAYQPGQHRRVLLEGWTMNNSSAFQR